jgi:hypothetical protein
MDEKYPRTVADTAKDIRVGLDHVFQDSIDTVKKNATVSVYVRFRVVRA